MYRQYPTDYKLETYLKIARLYLEEDPVQAEAYINRASLLQADSKNEELQIHYKVCTVLLTGMGTITQTCNRLIIDYIAEFIIINRLHLFLSSNRLLYNSIHERNTCIFIDKFTWNCRVLYYLCTIKCL